MGRVELGKDFHEDDTGELIAPRSLLLFTATRSGIMFA